MKSVLYFLAASSGINAQFGGQFRDEMLHGKKKGMFDAGMGDGGGPKIKEQPDCPPGDNLSPFVGIAFSSDKIWIRREVDHTDPQCEELLSLNGANVTELYKAAKTCGPIGEYKRRIADILSVVMFQGGFDWDGNEGGEVNVVTDKYEGKVAVSEEKWKLLQECWHSGCDCEQVSTPGVRYVMYLILLCCLVGILYDSLALSLGWQTKEKKKEKKDKKDKKEKKEKKKKDKDSDDGKSAKDSDKDGVDSSPDEPIASTDTPLASEDDDAKKKK